MLVPYSTLRSYQLAAKSSSSSWRELRSSKGSRRLLVSDRRGLELHCHMKQKLVPGIRVCGCSWYFKIQNFDQFWNRTRNLPARRKHEFGVRLQTSRCRTTTRNETESRIIFILILESTYTKPIIGQDIMRDKKKLVSVAKIIYPKGQTWYGITFLRNEGGKVPRSPRDLSSRQKKETFDGKWLL